MQPLSPQQLQQALAERPSWHLIDGKLVREWVFPDFLAAISFVQQVATLAEVAHHHPDIDIRYNRVRLGLTTHDAGGISLRDVEFTKQLGTTFPEK